MPVKDETGKIYGQLQVLSQAANIGDKAAWCCKCSCGAIHITSGDALRTGKVKSCGCYRRSGDHTRAHGHGSSRRGVSPTYKSWQEMRARCGNPQHVSYPNYGGRGISITPDWSEFEVFLRDMGVRPKGTTLDRVKNELGYSKDNCRWATRHTQNNNRRNVQLIEYLGKTQSLTAWCRELNIPYPRTYNRFVTKHEPFGLAITPKRKPGIQP